MLAEGMILSGVSQLGNGTVIGWPSGESRQTGDEGESGQSSANLSGKRTVKMQIEKAAEKFFCVF